MKFRLFCIVSLLFLLTGRVSADATDDLVRAEMKRSRIPGVAVAVVRDGKPVKMQGYGYANLEHKIAVTPETVFQLGSVGKQFTAGAVLLVAQDGKLALGDSITKYLPFAPEAWKPITVQHLLQHTSGIPDYTEFMNPMQDATDEATAQKIARKPLDFTPGSQWKYSNTNYLLLGILIEKVTGKFYGEILRERVFQPLGMTTARINNEAEIIPNRAAGYEPTRDGVRNQAYVAPTINTYADGSVIMSLRDMVRWDQALNTDKPFSARVREQMWTPATLTDGKKTNYGCGWMVYEQGGHRVVEHSGAWQGFTAHIARYLDNKLSIIVLTNYSGANPARLARQIAATYIPTLKVFAEPQPDKSVEQDPEIIALVRQVIEEMRENKLDLNRFSKEMQDALADQPRGQIAAVLKALGEMKSVTVLNKNKTGKDNTYRIRIEFAQRQGIVVLSLDPQGKISGLLLQPE